MNLDAEYIVQIYKRKVAAKDAEIERLRELVKEMSDKLQSDYYCGLKDLSDGCGLTDICPSAYTCALVARAREVEGGNQTK